MPCTDGGYSEIAAERELRKLGVKFTTEMNFDLDELKWNLTTKLWDDSESDEDEE